MIRCDTYYSKKIVFRRTVFSYGGCFFDTILHIDIAAFEVWSERVKILIVNILYNI